VEQDSAEIPVSPSGPIMSWGKSDQNPAISKLAEIWKKSIRRQYLTVLITEIPENQLWKKTES
jgi:hypothetical protein